MLDLNLPNILTLFRLVLLVPMVALFFLPFEWAAWTTLGLYIAGAVTDYLDGWIARRHNKKSALGTMLDPISDKIFVATIMLMLVAINRIEGLLVLSVVVIIVREFIVSGLREFLGPKGVKVPVSKLAKWKTATQMGALGVLIVAPYIPLGMILGGTLLTAAALITLYTGWSYLKTGLNSIKNDR